MFRLMHGEVRITLFEKSNGEAGFGGHHRRVREAHPFKPLGETLIARQWNAFFVPTKQTLDSHDVRPAQPTRDQTRAFFSTPSMNQRRADDAARAPDQQRSHRVSRPNPKPL